MSKSVDSPLGTVLVLDEPDVIRRKFRRAVTDSESEVRYDPVAKPGVANLLSILAAATDNTPEALAGKYTPIRAAQGRRRRGRGRAAATPPGALRRAGRGSGRDARGILATGAAKARAMAGPTITRVRERLGLPPL